MESAEIRSEAAAAAFDATVLTALTDQWERVGEVAARVEYWQRPTVRSALWRLMKDGHIDAEQRLLQSGPEHRMQMGYYWVFRRKAPRLEGPPGQWSRAIRRIDPLATAGIDPLSEVLHGGV